MTDEEFAGFVIRAAEGPGYYVEQIVEHPSVQPAVLAAFSDWSALMAWLADQESEDAA